MKERTIASVTMKELAQEDAKSFISEIDEKLLSLHSYYVIGYKNLIVFDESMNDSELDELYQSTPYLNLLAVKSQVEEIEQELSELRDDKQKLLLERIHEFSKRSSVAAVSMANLLEETGHDLKQADIEKEWKSLETGREFIIYEKNIEHLAHMMDLSFKEVSQKFKPSEGAMGNLSGQEFPSKVWSLTFDNGPHETYSPMILKNLKAKGLKASFFQTTSGVKKHKEISQLIRDAGMEIGSRSYTNKDLTKVGGITLEREIGLASSELKKDLKIPVKFFRLPYAAGISVPGIRNTIARNNLIHVFWNVDTLDWMAQSPDRIVERTKRMMNKTPRDAGVILFHETSLRSVKASAKIMDLLKENGRRSCTLGRIVKDMNEDSKKVCSRN